MISYKESIDNDWTKKENEDSENEEDDDEDEQDNDLLASSMKVTSGISDGIIGNDQIRLTDLGTINSGNVHKSVITVIKWHESGKIIMSGGLDKTLCLYSMEDLNTRNSKNISHNLLIKKLFITDLPIRCASFTNDGKEIFISGRRHWIYSFNLINFKLYRINKLIGRDERSWESFIVSPNNQYVVFIAVRGSLCVISRKTKKPIKTISINQQISMIKFNQNGDKLYILTQIGYIYVYNMNTFKCCNKILFDGIVKATCFDIMESSNLISIGCNSGVVTLYKIENENKSKMIYNINNLITTINGIQFNHDGQLMIIWSKIKKEAIRLIHVETGKVYSNWPKHRGLSFVYQAQFSPNSGYLAIGNDRGQLKLMRLHFYGNL